MVYEIFFCKPFSKTRVWLLALSALGTMSRLCDRRRPRSRPNKAVDEVVIEGGAVGLKLGSD